jgi:hypothetical protein
MLLPTQASINAGFVFPNGVTMQKKPRLTERYLAGLVAVI